MGIVYDYYKNAHVNYSDFWSTTTTMTDGILKTDPYSFVGGFGFNKPSSQSPAYLFLKEAEDRINLNRTFKIDHILKNGDYTTVIWKDGTKTIVKKASDESDDPEKALLFAMLKKVCGNNGSEMARYLRKAEEKTVIKVPKIKIRERNDGSFPDDELPESCKDCTHRNEEVEPGNACYLCFNKCNKEAKDDAINKVKEDAKEYMISNVKYLRKCGYSYKKIADELKLSESTVRRYSSKEDEKNE